MGTQGLKQIRIDSYPEKKNNLILTNLPPEKENDAVEKEKKNMILLSENNEKCKDSTLIEEVFVNHCFLRALDRKTRQQIIKEMSYYSVKAKKEIFKQGDAPGCFYILSNGTCEMLINGAKVKTLEKGDYFGDRAILYGTNREYTVKTNTDCYVWLMDRENFKNIIDYKLKMIFEDNNKSISKFPNFATTSADERLKLSENIYREEYTSAREIIYEKGTVSNCIYVVKDGKVTLKKDGKQMRIANRGESFGVLEVLSNSNRITEATPAGKTNLLTIPVFWLKSLYGENFRSVVALTIIKSAFANHPSFKKSNLNFLDEIFGRFVFKYYERETDIIRSGEQKCNLIVVPIEGELVEANGRVICQKNNLLFGKEIFEEDNSKTTSAIKCRPYSLIATLKNSDIKSQFRCTLKELEEKNSVIDKLKESDFFRNFTKQKLDMLYKKLKVKKYKNNESILTQGTESTLFYIIKKGGVDFYNKNKRVFSKGKNDYFGERNLLFKEPNTETSKAHGEVEVYFLEKRDFESVAEKNLLDYLKEREFLLDNNMQLNDLIYYKDLGEGSYGNVCLVKNKKNGYFYAIKSMPCKQILYSLLNSNVEIERSILSKLDHPFIVRLVKALKDKNYIYFLMDYIKGKELFDAMRDIGMLNKNQARFYAASVMVAINYLHERKIIFRDIKPENVMVLANGFCKLIDFGTAKSIIDRTQTTIGTPHYMAPEIILGAGYSFKVDFWSIAVMMYEFMCGGMPFGDEEEETMDIYLAIINE